ncbi:MAG TPA: hypothetical protein VI386_17320 [Candidatus Sulfotelmatobacter sp.]
MYKQIAFLLLLPLLADAQQNSSSQTASNTSYVTTASAPDQSTQMKILPSTPTPRITENSENAEPSGFYVTLSSEKLLGPPKPPIERINVWDKKFIAAHSFFLGSLVYDAELTHQGLAHHRCVEGNSHLGTHPGRGEIYGKSLLAFSAITGADWLIGKTGIRYLPYLGATAGSAFHLSGGSKWLADCW